MIGDDGLRHSDILGSEGAESIAQGGVKEAAQAHQIFPQGALGA